MVFVSVEMETTSLTEDDRHQSGVDDYGTITSGRQRRSVSPSATRSDDTTRILTDDQLVVSSVLCWYKMFCYICLSVPSCLSLCLHCRPSLRTTRHQNKELSYHRDSARCVKRPFRVTHNHPLLCQSTRHMWLPISTQYDINLTSVFKRSWDITPSLHIHTPPLFHVELEKGGCD